MIDGAETDAATMMELAADAAIDELTQVRAQLAVRDVRLDQLQRICDERQRVIDELAANLELFRAVAAERAEVIARLNEGLQERQRSAHEASPAVELLRAKLAERLEEIDRVSRERDALGLAAEAIQRARADDRAQATFAEDGLRADLQAALRAADTLRARLDPLEAELAARSEVIATLQQACAERLTLIERLSAEIDTLRAISNAAGDDVDWRALALERERALAELSAEAEKRAVLLAEVTAALHDRTQEAAQLRTSGARAS